MQLSEIKITSLSITGNQDGSEKLYMAVAYGEGDNEVFLSKEMATKGVVTLAHIDLIMQFIRNSAAGD